MTPAEIAADVAARYGVQCRPEVVQIIPRGVSGLPDPAAPGEHWTVGHRAKLSAWYANAARAKRLRKAMAAEGER